MFNATNARQYLSMMIGTYSFDKNQRCYRFFFINNQESFNNNKRANTQLLNDNYS